jgi:hypothetical protein
MTEGLSLISIMLKKLRGEMQNASVGARMAEARPFAAEEKPGFS